MIKRFRYILSAKVTIFAELSNKKAEKNKKMCHFRGTL